MADEHVDVPALYQDLDAARESKGLTWRELARVLKLSPSTLSRLSNHKSPDVHAFMAMTQWLAIPAERYLIRRDDVAGSEEPGAVERPELVAELAPLLRAREELSSEDVDYLQEIIGAAVRRFAASRRPEPE